MSRLNSKVIRKRKACRKCGVHIGYWVWEERKARKVSYTGEFEFNDRHSKDLVCKKCDLAKPEEPRR